MARITINNVKTSLGIKETYDIVNAIRNSASDSFQQYVPLASAENVAQIGQGILVNQTTQNEFITSLVDRIGLVVVRSLSLQNPLKKFKKGAMLQGKTIEEIFTDITKSKKYDPDDAENTVFKRTIPNVKTLFHERNRQDRYDQTIQDESLKSAFTSWANFEGFVSSIIGAIYNSAEVEEYEYMKLLIDNYYAKGQFKIIPVADPAASVDNAKAFIKKVRATVTKMSLPNGSRDFNALAVHTRSEVSNLHLIIDADLAAEIDVEVLAVAFNMDKASFMGNVTILDGFASTGLKAVIVDEDWFMVFDNLLKLETIRNPKGLYWNYFYHVWQTLSVSRFANAVAFVAGTVPAVNQIIVTPTINALKAGATFTYNAVIRQTDTKAYTVKWSIVGTGLKAGTTINATTGVLTIDATEPSGTQFSVVATGQDGATPLTVTGESIVSVL